MKYDAIIIGGGLGGLECGYILSRNGLSVLLLEQGAQLGGCLQSYRRRGQSFDTGFHYVGGLDEGQSLHPAFGYLGLLDLPWHRLDADGFDRVSIGYRTFAFAQGYDQFADRLAEQFPSQRAALHQYASLLKSSATHQLAALNPQAEASQSPIDPMATSAWQYLNDTFGDPLLINVLSGTSLKMELRKETLPLFTFLHGNGGFVESSWRLKGDSSLIAERLASGIRAQGGEIVCNARVQELVEKEGKLAYAICSNGETYEGRLFISDTHPALTCQMVKQSSCMKNVYRNRIARLENTFGMATVSLTIKPGKLQYFNWNQYIYRTPDVWAAHASNRQVAGILVSCRVPEIGTCARQIDLLTPMQWSECSKWSDTHVGNRGDDYKALKEQLADECIDLAERFIPGLREMTENCYVSTPLTWRDYTLTPEGCAYGIRKDFNQPLLTMLSPRTPIPNLLQTGQNLILHGIHGVTMTAFHTCAEVLGREKIWQIIGNE